MAENSEIALESPCPNREQYDLLFSALNEVVTNGRDTAGEQRGDWIISREVYDDAKYAIDVCRQRDAGRRANLNREWDELPT